MVSIKRSLVQFRMHPLRTLLTLLGMVFGVGALVAMVSIGEGAQQEIVANIEAMGADIVHIKSRPVEEKLLSEIINDSIGLSRFDANALRRVVPVEAVTYRKTIRIGVCDLGVPLQSMQVLGVGPDLFEVHQLEMQKGRPLLSFDNTQHHRVAVMGPALAQKAFPQGALGKRIRLEYAFFEVVGILESRVVDGDLPVDPEIYNNAVLIPFETATQELFPAEVYNEIDLISIRTSTPERTLATKQAVLPVLKNLHGGVEDFEVVAPEEILQQRKATQSIMNMVLVCIAAISLLVGGIGVMNIMLANIMERISEIGLRRALGASRTEIRNQFLSEAVLICLIGGLTGIVLGFSISTTVAWMVGLPIAFAWTSVILSFLVSAGVGVTFGIVPAMRAAHINPIEALQNE